MGKSQGGKGKKRQRKPRTSSGKRRVSRARQALLRLRMKIKRWKKNQTDEKKVQAGKGCRGWDTTGLEKHMEHLKKVIKKGPKKPKYVPKPSILG